MNNSLSILDYIYSSLVDGKLPEDFSLPSSKKDDELYFADGAMDGIYIYHMQKQEMSDEDKSIMIDAINAASNSDFEKADELFIKLSQNNRAISIIDTLQQYISDNADNLKAGNLYEYAIVVIAISDNKECIKYALSILELLNTNNDELKRNIKTLALSDEFTFFCVYIMKRWPNGNDDIFETAKNVYGWGRIHALELLRPLMPREEEIREWMLKEGINNNVMPSYSALTCRKNGNIGSILYVDPSQEQLVYIGRIIDAMLDEDAVPGISTLDKRIDILLKYLDKIKKYPLTIETYEIIYHIYKYSKEVNALELSKVANDMLHTYNAKIKITDAIKKGEALDLAIEIGIDVKPYVIKLIKDSFKKYYHLCRYVCNDNPYRKELLKVYKDNLPLEKMKTLPSNSFGIGEEYWKESALEFLLQELRSYPLEGIEFVEAGLTSSPTRTRNASLTVLKHWVQKENKSLYKLLPGTYFLLNDLVKIEPSESAKEIMNELLSGKTSFKEEVFTLEKNEEIINKESLNILSDAISDIGRWQWWNIDNDTVMLEFCDVQLYDDTRDIKEPHSSVISLQFTNNSFALFLDNLNNIDNKKWYEKLHDDEIEPFPLEGYEFEFNNSKYINELFEIYKNKTSIKDLPDKEIVSNKYILGAKCNGVGFFVGGDNLKVYTHSGEMSNEEIKELNKKWWDYWEDYWLKRNTKDAYEKDFACEFTIPADRFNPKNSH